MNLDELVRFYETLTPGDVPRFREFYADDAYFKDPFNEVRGLSAIQRIFNHMFHQVEEPSFRVVERIADSHGAMLAWEFWFLVRILGRSETHVLRGVTHLRFAPDGKVAYHRDYWDAAEELYMKLPGIGLLMRGLRRAFSA